MENERVIRGSKRGLAFPCHGGSDAAAFAFISLSRVTQEEILRWLSFRISFVCVFFSLFIYLFSFLFFIFFFSFLLSRGDIATFD